jgi:putative mRNA 3-end processing factor
VLKVNGKIISIDSKVSNSDINFISHAHTDHISALNSSKEILASIETIELLNAIKNKNIYQLNLPNWVELLDAGHILGSKQLYMVDNETGERIIYTGDYNLQKSNVCKPIQIKKAEKLIIDSTYYDPKMKFLDKEIIIDSIKKWIEKNIDNNIIIFGVYALGKAQELINIFNEIGIVPIVSKKISIISDIYNKFGYKLNYLSSYDNNFDEKELEHNFVGIINTQSLTKLKFSLSNFYNKKIMTAVATGFAKTYNFNVDKQFPLSNHADFHQAIEYINAVDADNIFTFGHNAKIFANYLNNEGYQAKVFNDN